MGRLENKIALVTGASRGFGKAIALAFAAEGADVVVNYVSNRAAAVEVAAAVEQMGRRALLAVADVADEEQVRRLAEETVAEFGRIDLLVNNAGVMTIGPFLDQDVSTWKQMIDVNVLGTLLCCKHVLPVMVRQRYGKVINLASQLAWTNAANFAVYGATKAAVLGLTQSLAKEFGPYNINVNAIGPGSIETDMSRDVFSEAAKQRRIAELPVRRMGTPRDVALTAVFLASEDSSFYAGQMLGPNGGLIM